MKTIECPGCGESIELTKLRPIEVQCGDCDVWVSHDWPENFGENKDDVTKLRENHVRNINDEKNRKQSTEEEREKAKGYAAKSRAKKRAERLAEELPEHQALYDGMTPKHRASAKYEFPRDTHPEDMTPEERKMLRDYKGVVAANLKYNTKAAADPEGERVKQKAARDAKPASTIEQKAEHAQYMKVYYDENPGKRKANDDVQNAKKKEKRDEAREVEDVQLPVAACPACYGVVALTVAKNRVPLRILECDAEGCATFFSSQWPMKIFGTDRVEVEKHIKREEAKAIRLGWTDEQKEADKAKDKAKRERTAADKEKQEKEMERCRLKAKKKRDEIKEDPEAYAQSLLDNQARHAKRRQPGGDSAPTPENLAKRNAAYAEKRSVAALATSDPEKLEQVQRERREKYIREVAEGDAYFQRVRKDPVLYEEYKRKMRERRLDYAQTCPICDKRHGSKDSDWCRDCRTGMKRTKVYETEVANFFLANGMLWSSSNEKPGCDGKDADTNVRPDFIFKAPGTPNIVIVEVDEDQHRSYPLECEIARMAKVRDAAARESAVGIGATGSPGMGIIVIRYNPERTLLINRERDKVAITRASKELLLDCLRQALQRGPSNAILGYEQVFLNYDESRVVMFLHTELRMNAEGLESFGSSSSSSSSDSSLGPNTTTGTVDLLMQHSDDFINRVRKMKEKEKAQHHAKREADHREAKKIKYTKKQ